MIPSNVCEGISLADFTHNLELFVDASHQSWGAHLVGETVSDLWPRTEAGWHSNNREMQAIILAFQHWQDRLRGTRVLIVSVNSAVVWLIRNHGTT